MNKILVVVVIIFTLFIFGCKEEPSEVSDLQVDAVVEQMAGFGWQANQYVQTGGEVEQTTQESEILNGTDIEIPGKNNSSKETALEMFEEIHKYLPKTSDLNKSVSDSLYFFFDDTLFGVRTALFYDSETGIARFYHAKYKFAVWRNLVYDSSEIVVDANGTLEDGSDDMLESFHQTQNFKERYFIQTIIGDLIVTDFTGSEITGAELTQDTYYKSDRYISHLHRFADFNPDDSGTLREEFNYSDGSSTFHQFTYNGDFTGSFVKQFRDGTNVSGTFDMVEDDLRGAWTELIQFPSGRYLNKIERAADIEILLPDSTFNAELFEAIYFSNGNVDSSAMDISVSEMNGVKTIVLSINKKNGAHGTFTIQENDEQSDVDGNWTTWNDYYIKLTAEIYIDGSGHVHYEVWLPTQNPQTDEPVLVVDYYFSPDNEGTGTISYNRETYSIVTDASGQVTISKGGKSKQVNILQ